MHWRRHTALMVSLSLAATVGPLEAQTGGWHEATTTSQLQEYLRVLQVAGIVPLHPVSLRSYSPSELDLLAPADSAHPWGWQLPRGETGARRMRLRRPEGSLILNTTGPVGRNDGAVWAGRGATAVARGGVVVRSGPLTVAVDPVLFVTQNASFPLAENPAEGTLPYAHRAYPGSIDLPQRFGDGAYARIDPGQSTLRVDIGGFGAGVSTENESWGPAVEYPLILGANAPGIPRVFIGTSTPRDIYIGRLHSRLFLGQLNISGHSASPPEHSRWLASALAVVFVPRGAPGLEIGASRFFHTHWPEGGPRLGHLTMPLGTVVKSDATSAPSTDNELSSVFFRYVAQGGFEMYGEFAKDDHSFQASPAVVLREFITQPDHVSAYMLGFRRAWPRGPQRVTSLRTEFVNLRRSHLARTHHQGAVYTHAGIQAGHTNRGQLLGAPTGIEGDAQVVVLERYGRGGMTGIGLRRESSLSSAELPQVAPRRVVLSVEAQAVRFARGWEIGTSAALGLPVAGAGEERSHGGRLSVWVRPAGGQQSLLPQTSTGREGRRARGQ